MNPNSLNERHKTTNSPEALQLLTLLRQAVSATCAKIAEYPAKAESVTYYFTSHDDWYEIFGQGIYIKTNACISLALGTEAVLNIAAGGYGSFHIDGNQFMVEGVYSLLRL